eukprot:COSAG04_NODE_4_length_52282_cov_12.667133_50_plen_240_part_00
MPGRWRLISMTAMLWDSQSGGGERGVHQRGLLLRRRPCKVDRRIRLAQHHAARAGAVGQVVHRPGDEGDAPLHARRQAGEGGAAIFGEEEGAGRRGAVLRRWLRDVQPGGGVDQLDVGSRHGAGVGDPSVPVQAAQAAASGQLSGHTQAPQTHRPAAERQPCPSSAPDPRVAEGAGAGREGVRHGRRVPSALLQQLRRRVRLLELPRITPTQLVVRTVGSNAMRQTTECGERPRCTDPL